MGSVKSLVKIDVDRTNAELDFFQDEKIKNAMIEVLTVWSAKNSDMKYKQGMNEISGLLILVLHEEYITNPYPGASDKELIGSYFRC